VSISGKERLFRFLAGLAALALRVSLWPPGREKQPGLTRHDEARSGGITPLQDFTHSGSDWDIPKACVGNGFVVGTLTRRVARLHLKKSGPPIEEDTVEGLIEEPLCSPDPEHGKRVGLLLDFALPARGRGKEDANLFRRKLESRSSFHVTSSMTADLSISRRP
jgi:hypothetical protein